MREKNYSSGQFEKRGDAKERKEVLTGEARRKKRRRWWEEEEEEEKEEVLNSK